MPVNEVNRIMDPMDLDDAVRASPHPTGCCVMGVSLIPPKAVRTGNFTLINSNPITGVPI